MGFKLAEIFVEIKGDTKHVADAMNSVRAQAATTAAAVAGVSKATVGMAGAVATAAAGASAAAAGAITRTVNWTRVVNTSATQAAHAVWSIGQRAAATRVMLEGMTGDSRRLLPAMASSAIVVRNAMAATAVQVRRVREATAGGFGGGGGDAGGMGGARWGDAFRGISDGVAAARQRLRALREDFRELGAMATKGLLAIGAATAGVAYVFGRFEQSMARVNALTGATQEEFQRLTTAARDLGRTTIFSASQAAEAMAEFAQQGFKTNEIIASMPATLALAAAGQLSMSQSAMATAGIMRGMKLGTEDLTHVVDVLAKAATSSATNIPELAEAMRQIGPVGRAAGASIEEIIGALRGMADVMIRGANAGTALRNIYIRLQAQPAEVKKALDQLGVSIADQGGRMRSLADIVDDLNRALEGYDETQRNAIVSQVAGLRATAAFSEILELGGDTLRRYTQELENSGGTAERVAKIQQNTLFGTIERLKSAVDDLVIKLGTALSPALRSLSASLTSAADWLGKLSPETVRWGVAIAGATAGVLAMIKAVSMLAVALGGALATPLGAAIVAIGLLTAALTASRIEAELAAAAAAELAAQLNALAQIKQASAGADRANAAKAQVSELNKEIEKQVQLIADLQKTVATGEAWQIGFAKTDLKDAEARLKRLREMRAIAEREQAEGEQQAARGQASSPGGPPTDATDGSAPKSVKQITDDMRKEWSDVEFDLYLESLNATDQRIALAVREANERLAAAEKVAESDADLADKRLQIEEALNRKVQEIRDEAAAEEQKRMEREEKEAARIAKAKADHERREQERIRREQDRAADRLGDILSRARRTITRHQFGDIAAQVQELKEQFVEAIRGVKGGPARNLITKAFAIDLAEARNPKRQATLSGILDYARGLTIAAASPKGATDKQILDAQHELVRAAREQKDLDKERNALLKQLKNNGLGIQVVN